MQNADAGDEPTAYAEIVASRVTAVSPAEFTAGVSGTQVTVLLADLWTVYHYARHFDCDDDPSMGRIREAVDAAEAAVAAHTSAHE